MPLASSSASRLGARRQAHPYEVGGSHSKTSDSFASLGPRGGCYNHEEDTATDVATHFRVSIPSGQATFTVQVPQHHLQDTRRRFSFNQLHLTPDFYSLEAEKLALDADPQLDKIIERDAAIKLTYANVKLAYGAHFERGNAITSTLEMLAEINAHFESKKPDYAITTPLFIDWMDTSLHTTNEPSIYVPVQDQVYYNEDFDERKHADFLPESVRELKGVNNYLPPISDKNPPDPVTLSRIRLRFWMAPYTRAVFSNTYAFVHEFGFTNLPTLGTAVNRQTHLLNDKPYWLPVMVAEEAPTLVMAKVPFKMAARAVKDTVLSKIKHIAIVERDWLDNTKLAETLVEAFNQTSRSLNTVLSIAFDTQDNTFKLTLPDSTNLQVQVVCDASFAHRLGFGYETLIVKGMKAEPQKDRFSNQDAQKRAAAVVYDTGPIVCTLDHVSSNTTSGSLYQTMAALYPRSSGTLSMPMIGCQCATMTSMTVGADQLMVNTYTGATTVPVTFRLLRIYDDQNITDFSWKSNAVIYGVFQGVCPRL